MGNTATTLIIPTSLPDTTDNINVLKTLIDVLEQVKAAPKISRSDRRLLRKTLKEIFSSNSNDSDIDLIVQNPRLLRKILRRLRDLVQRQYQDTNPTYWENLQASTAQGSAITKSSPPASNFIIEGLATIRVAEESSDHVCQVCCENYKVGDRETKLPCGHSYHEGCILNWLTKHCTCPVCRYELPTDDPIYELGRCRRMKARNDVPCIFTCIRDSDMNDDELSADFGRVDAHWQIELPS